MTEITILSFLMKSGFVGVSHYKPVNSNEWVKKLNKQKNDVHHLDIDLNFSGGKYFACLRLSRGLRGVFEVIILFAIL